MGSVRIYIYMVNKLVNIIYIITNQYILYIYNKWK